jgi:SAM-dependent methyltransferase
MQRSQVPEIMDDPNCPEDVLQTGHRGLQRIHRLLGNTRFLIRALASDPHHVRRVMDIGCGRGGLLAQIRRRLPVETIGVDLRPSPGVLRLNAVHDPLPEADVALAVYMLHHLDEADVVKLIRNVRRSCRRFIILETVRHPAPLWLYRIFIAPVVPKVNAVDGARSVERGFTVRELNGLVRQAADGDPFRHSVGPLYTRQVVDM